MTTIAWDGTTLAVDRGGWNGRMVRPTKKITVIQLGREGWPLGAYASTGNAAFNRELALWMQGVVAELPKLAKAEELDDECGLYITNDKIAYSVTQRGILLEIPGQYATAGGGREFALGCMVAGKTAVEAVTLAQLHTDCSAFGIDTWSPK